MLTEETKKELKTAPTDPEAEVTNEEPTPQEPVRGNWREAFVAAFQKARQQQKPTESRQELGRDKSKSLFLLVGVCVVLLLRTKVSPLILMAAAGALGALGLVQ